MHFMCIFLISGPTTKNIVILSWKWRWSSTWWFSWEIAFSDQLWGDSIRVWKLSVSAEGGLRMQRAASATRLVPSLSQVSGRVGNFFNSFSTLWKRMPHSPPTKSSNIFFHIRSAHVLQVVLCCIIGYIRPLQECIHLDCQTSLKWYSTIAVLSGTLVPAGTFFEK